MQKGAINLWMAVRKVDFPTARKELAQWLGLTVTDTGASHQNGSFDWSACVSAIAARSDRLHEIENWRGFSHKFCTWLTDHKLLGLFRDCIAFPICKNGEVTSPHFLLDRAK